MLANIETELKMCTNITRFFIVGTCKKLALLIFKKINQYRTCKLQIASQSIVIKLRVFIQL